MIFFFAEIEESILKCIWNFKRQQLSKGMAKEPVLKKNKIQVSYFLISKLTTKLQQSKHHDTGINTDS